MAAQSKSTSTRRKSKSASPIATHANVTHIDPKRIKEQAFIKWQESLREFFAPLNDAETALIGRLLTLIYEKPKKSKPQSNKVINFASRKKQSAMEEV